MDEEEKSLYEDAKNKIMDIPIPYQKETNYNLPKLNIQEKIQTNKTYSKESINGNESSSYQDAYSKIEYIKKRDTREKKLKTFTNLTRNFISENNNINLDNIKIITNRSLYSGNSYTIPQFEIFEKESGCCDQVKCIIF